LQVLTGKGAEIDITTASGRMVFGRISPPPANTPYRQLARGIAESKGWKSILSKTGRARNRVIGKLMLRALNDE